MTTHWLEGDVTLRTMSMHYARSGGVKPALVLAHGFSDNGMCWLPAAQELAADYDVILPDAKGHGKSSRVTAGEKADRAADMAEFIRALKLERPVLAGHSMGGFTASAVAAQYPDLISAVIMEDPAWFERRPNQPARASEDNPWLKELQRYAALSTEEVMAACRTQNPLWMELELRPWAESKQLFDLNVFSVHDNLMDIDWKDLARQIRVPALLITADASKGAIITPELAAKARALNPLIQVAEVPNVGHNIRRENFPAFMTAVRAFLKQL